MTPTDQTAFLEAACVPLDKDHRSGDLADAEAIRAAHPEVDTESIYTAAALGDDDAVRRFIEADSSLATAKGGSRNWDALTYLCFSRYLRLDKTRSSGFERAAAALLEAGASANTGWFEKDHEPQPVWESVLYGAAGVAQHAGVTRVLLDHGGDPNDDETPYHVPETHNNTVLKVLLESGRLNPESFSMLLLRKTDWHDYEGVKLLLEDGVDPNRVTRWGKTAIHNAIISDNDLEIVEVLLDHGADPLLRADRPHRKPFSVPAQSAVEMAARRGRGDLLRLFRDRGISIKLDGVEALIAACALDDKAEISRLVSEQPKLKDEIVAQGARLIAEFSGNDNAPGVGHLIDLGVPVDAVYEEGDGYFGIARKSTALSVAAWRASHDTVKLLIARGASVDAKNENGRTPLHLAIKACVDSFWTERRKTQSIEALLSAGASTEGIPEHTGYDEADKLIAAANAQRRRG